MPRSGNGRILQGPMKNKPHQRKAEIDLHKAEEDMHKVLGKGHPEWIRKNGDCPSCLSLEHEMADTARPESAEVALDEEDRDKRVQDKQAK